MDRLIFSQTAVFRLQQLASHLHQETGTRHKLSTTRGIVDLLKDGAKHQDGNVKGCYEAFVLELNKRQINTLAAEGIVISAPSGMHSNRAQQAG
jgi:hypothetical protein